MLKLTTYDLGPQQEGGRPGVTVWWVKFPKVKTPRTMIAWDTAVFVAHKVEWPEEIVVKAIQGWGAEAQRLTWVKDLGQIVIRGGVTHPNIVPLLGLKPGDTIRASAGHRDWFMSRRTEVGGKSRRLYLQRVKPVDGSKHVLLSMTMLKRVVAMLGRRLGILDLRIMRTKVGPDIVIAWKNDKLRAVMSAVDEDGD